MNTILAWIGILFISNLVGCAIVIFIGPWVRRKIVNWFACPQFRGGWCTKCGHCEPLLFGALDFAPERCVCGAVPSGVGSAVNQWRYRTIRKKRFWRLRQRKNRWGLVDPKHFMNKLR